MENERRKIEMTLAFAVLFTMLVSISVGCVSGGGAPPEEEWNNNFSRSSDNLGYWHLHFGDLFEITKRK